MASSDEEYNEKLPGYWELLESGRVFELFSLKEPECSLLKELIFVMKIHVFNNGDKTTISEKIFDILQGKIRRCK